MHDVAAPSCATFTERVLADQAAQVRAILTARVRLQVTEKAHWFWDQVTFTVSGPSEAVAAAKAELDDWLLLDQADRSW